MAIDGQIKKTRTRNQCLFIYLEPSFHHGSWSITGQPRLIVRNYSHVPAVGQIVWGGSDLVIIEPGQGITERKQYKRDGCGAYIKEDWHDKGQGKTG